MLSKRLDDRMKTNNAEVFKIQTQIRAQLNNLRKTYQDTMNTSKKGIERRHFPEQLYKETLKTPDQDDHLTNRSNSESKPMNRGKRKIQPFHFQDRKSASPLQRRHYPRHYNDNINLQIKKSRHPSAYLIKRDNSPTPQRRTKSILGFIDQRKYSVERPSKRIIPNKHTFTKQFF